MNATIAIYIKQPASRAPPLRQTSQHQAPLLGHPPEQEHETTRRKMENNTQNAWTMILSAIAAASGLANLLWNTWTSYKDRSLQESTEYFKLSSALEDYANEQRKYVQSVDDFLYHQEYSASDFYGSNIKKRKPIQMERPPTSIFTEALDNMKHISPESRQEIRNLLNKINSIIESKDLIFENEELEIEDLARLGIQESASCAIEALKTAEATRKRSGANSTDLTSQRRYFEEIIEQQIKEARGWNEKLIPSLRPLTPPSTQ